MQTKNIHTIYEIIDNTHTSPGPGVVFNENTFFTTAAVQIWEDRLLKRLDSTDFKKYFINQTVFRSSSKTDHSLNSYQSFQNIVTCYYTKNTADFDNSIHHWSGFIEPYLTKYQSISFTSQRIF